MSYTLRLIAFLGMQLLFTALAHGQSNAVKASIPFAFSVQGKSMPAGDYLVDTVANGGGLMLRTANHEALTTVMSITNSPSAGHTGLSFLHRGSEYILTSVELPNGQINLPSARAGRTKPAAIPMTSATIRPRQ